MFRSCLGSSVDVAPPCFELRYRVARYVCCAAMASSSTEEAAQHQDVRDVLRELSKPLSFLDTRGVEKACGFVESAKIFLRWNAKQLVASAEDAPVALVYSGDGTPIEMRRRTWVKFAGQTVRRSGYATHELYVQQAMLRALNAEGEVQTALVLSDPCPLTYGKAAPAQMACRRCEG